MNAANCKLAKGLVSSTYIEQGEQALTARTNLVRTLLSQRQLPEAGWDDASIEAFIQVVLLTHRLKSSACCTYTGSIISQGLDFKRDMLAGCCQHGQQQLPWQCWSG